MEKGGQASRPDFFDCNEYLNTTYEAKTGYPVKSPASR
jgi:hypothetical protein